MDSEFATNEQRLAVRTLPPMVCQCVPMPIIENDAGE